MMRSCGLHPVPQATQSCPYCETNLAVTGWCMPGMRALSELHCDRCEREYYGDLPAGQALYTPMLLEKATGVVHDKNGVEWFANWLRDSYANRREDDVQLEVVRHHQATIDVLILNCIDVMYGHSLLKLLNAQYHLDFFPDTSLVVIVPHWLAWLVPDGIAETWTVYLPLRRGIEWNEALGSKLKALISNFRSARLSSAYSHPRPTDYAIERLTRVAPFDLDAWDTALSLPTVTFVWRDDRLWGENQFERVVQLAEALRSSFGGLTFVVAGLGSREAAFPPWITDLRAERVDDDLERSWCRSYAGSHVVIGVHGSNMLLPSAHAGSVIELIGPKRWGNFAQDILFRDTGDGRELLFRYRFIPETTAPDDVAKLADMMLRKRSAYLDLMNVSVP